MKAVRFTVITPLFFIYSVLSAEDLTLRIDPSPEAEVLFTIPVDDAALTTGGPVLDEQLAAEGWMWGEYEGAFTGYLPDQKISKDLLPVVGAIIRAQPQEDARVLTTVTQEDIDENRITTQEPGLWWEIKFNKKIPVYFQKAEPVMPLELVSPEPLESAPSVIETEPLIEEPVIETAPEPKVQSVAPPTVANSNLPTTITGTLQKAKKRWLFRSPPYPFELVDENGKRIAYLNLEKAILNQPISEFIDKKVRAYGLIASNAKGHYSTLIATHLRSL